MSITNTLDSGIITGVLPQKSDLRLMVDDVEGITEGCTESILGEDLNCRQGHVVSCGIGGNQVDYGKTCNSSSELAPFSSSLTAFDVLTHIREPQITHNDATKDTEPLNKAISVGNNIL